MNDDEFPLVQREPQRVSMPEAGTDSTHAGSLSATLLAQMVEDSQMYGDYDVDPALVDAALKAARRDRA